MVIAFKLALIADAACFGLPAPGAFNLFLPCAFAVKTPGLRWEQPALGSRLARLFGAAGLHPVLPLERLQLYRHCEKPLGA